MEKTLINQETICNKIEVQKVARVVVEGSASGTGCCLNWKAWEPAAGRRSVRGWDSKPGQRELRGSQQLEGQFECHAGKKEEC